MKTRFLLTNLYLILSPLFLFAQLNSPEIHIQHCTFHHNDTSNYIESYFSINPQTLSYKKQTDSTYKSVLLITILFKNEKNEIVNFDKFQLETPKYKSIGEIMQNEQALIAQRRNGLPTGKYVIEVQAVNENLNFDEVKEVTLFNNESKFYYSDIELLDTFYECNTSSQFKKGNIDLIPSVINYFPTLKNQLSFFVELYKPEKNESFNKLIFQYSIVKKESGKIIDEFSNSTALEINAITPILNTIDITKLKSGNYILQIQALNRNNEILASSKIQFSRSKVAENRKGLFSDSNLVSQTDIQNTFANQFTSEQIKKRLATIYPIANSAEARYIDNLIKENKENNMKMFYYNFWKNRNPENPILAYNEYELQLIEVNKAFGMSFKYGFETDRGRVYLQYGAPNSINKSKQGGDMLPYEIWDYYSIGNQKNIKFIFYSKDRSTNEYQLASTNKRGEVSDPNWMSKIQNIPSNKDFEKSGYNKNYGNQLDRDMNTFIDK